MAIEYRTPTADHVRELGRICYEAFKDIAERHGFEPDFASPEFAAMVIGMLLAGETHYGIAAFDGGEPVGSNFLLMADDVAAVGPITVDPERQGAGIGRQLMDSVLAHARESGFESVRLMQDSFNMTSLSLYASLGFDVKHPAALMTPIPAQEADPTVRGITPDDLDAVEGLSRSIYKVSRRNEVRALTRGPFVGVARERAGRVVGYIVLGVAGHCVAETEDDALVLVQQAAMSAPPEMREVFCPLREGSLYRRFLAAGFRNKKVMNLMTRGPYEEPDGVWIPSIGF
jgi:predicted N-acetyltransferase YhbS